VLPRISVGKPRNDFVLYVTAMIGIIVGLDLAFFRNRFWERLMVNVGIVLVFAAFYRRMLEAFMDGRNSN
jgi:type IV secretory pathway VirB2 component (pilin)